MEISNGAQKSMKIVFIGVNIVDLDEMPQLFYMCICEVSKIQVVN